jgi:hypothetical protein
MTPDQSESIERYGDPATVAGASALRRLRDPRVGADHQNRGRYGIYFYDSAGDCVRSVGGFPSVKAAAGAVDLVIAETVIEEALQARDESEHDA